MYLDFIESIRNNSVLKLNNELDTKVKDVNPIMDLVKALAFELNIDSKNIENVLKKIEDRYENIDDLNDFTISDSEK
jgi:hypothetical protein